MSSLNTSTPTTNATSASTISTSNDQVAMDGSTSNLTSPSQNSPNSASATANVKPAVATSTNTSGVASIPTEIVVQVNIKAIKLSYILT